MNESLAVSSSFNGSDGQTCHFTFLSQPNVPPHDTEAMDTDLVEIRLASSLHRFDFQVPEQV